MKCKNCPLYDKKQALCEVIVLIDGIQKQCKTKANDDCIFEESDIPVQALRIFGQDGKDYVEITEDRDLE